MKNSIIKGVYFKLFAAIIIPTTLVFGLLSLMILKDHEKNLRAVMESKVEAISGLLKKISASSYQNFDYFTLDELATEANWDPEVVDVHFLDASGRLLAESIEKPVNEGSLLQFEKEIVDPGTHSRLGLSESGTTPA